MAGRFAGFTTSGEKVENESWHNPGRFYEDVGGILLLVLLLIPVMGFIWRVIQNCRSPAYQPLPNPKSLPEAASVRSGSRRESSPFVRSVACIVAQAAWHSNVLHGRPCVDAHPLLEVATSLPDMCSDLHRHVRAPDTA